MRVKTCRFVQSARTDNVSWSATKHTTCMPFNYHTKPVLRSRYSVRDPEQGRMRVRTCQSASTASTRKSHLVSNQAHDTHAGQLVQKKSATQQIPQDVCQSASRYNACQALAASAASATQQAEQASAGQQVQMTSSKHASKPMTCLPVNKHRTLLPVSTPAQQMSANQLERNHHSPQAGPSAVDLKSSVCMCAVM
jgi:hypothetical protein